MYIYLFQAERSSLLEVLKVNNIERPPMPELPPEPTDIEPPPKSADKLDIMSRNCSELKKSLAQLQGQMNALAAEKDKSDEPPAEVSRNKNKNKKNKSKVCPIKERNQNSNDVAKVRVSAAEKIEIVKSENEASVPLLPKETVENTHENTTDVIVAEKIDQAVLASENGIEPISPTKEILVGDDQPHTTENGCELLKDTLPIQEAPIPNGDNVPIAATS